MIQFWHCFFSSSFVSFSEWNHRSNSSIYIRPPFPVFSWFLQFLQIF